MDRLKPLSLGGLLILAACAGGRPINKCESLGYQKQTVHYGRCNDRLNPLGQASAPPLIATHP